MYCLSVRQPWAHMLIHGAIALDDCPVTQANKDLSKRWQAGDRVRKDVENRTWKTMHRGALLIHASKSIDKDGMDFISARFDLTQEKLVTGAILGKLYLKTCKRDSTSIWHDFGCCGWYVENSKPLPEPIPYRGRLKLFEVPDEVIRKALD